jgi:hypothetical protein
VPVTRRQAILAGAAAVLVAGGAATWWWAAADEPAPRPAPGATASTTPAPVPATPTGTPLATAEPAPAEPAPVPDPAPSADPGPRPEPAPGAAGVEVVTTYAGWNALSGAVEVGAYVPVVESDGVCTLELTGPGGERRAQATGTPDVSSTACGELSLTGLAPGSWQALVTYDSARSTGTSAPVTVEVP